ncbi:hypothetical protein HK105_205923 [Polyrhizophydium stewartii]|uniref:P-loop containing nucleoside triphosphate hydrolase protein n=1 Tax=Polyrhizophydium stewartii TaxID=2732419 RepID=A0ABR4N4T7_9FUNG
MGDTKLPASATQEAAAPSERWKVKRDPISFVTQSWLTRLFRAGFRKPLEQEDLPELSDNDKAIACAHVLDDFTAQFNAHQANPTAVKPPSLGFALTKAFYGYFLAEVVCQAVLVAVSIQMPLMTPQVIALLVPGADLSGVWVKNAYGTAAVLFIMQVSISIASYASQSIGYNMLIKMRSTLVGAIYRKALRLSPTEQQRFPAGKLNTLTTSDAVQVQGVVTGLLSVLSSAAQIGIALYNIARIFGQATWIAVGVFVFCILLMVSIMPFIYKHFTGYLKTSDNRTKVLREFLYGVKVIKFRAAEEFFHKKISESRDAQITHIRGITIMFFFVFFVMSLQQRILGPAAIAAFVGIYNDLNPAHIFTALGLFNALIIPAANISQSFTMFFNSYVSFKRVSDFMLAREIKPDEAGQVLPAADSPDGAAVKISAASFTWEVVLKDEDDSKGKGKGKGKDKDKGKKKPKNRIFKKKRGNESAASAKSADAENKEGDAAKKGGDNDKKDGDAESDKPAPFALQDITLDIPRGSLVAVVGSVGSGKSSLLSALIGSMRKTAGDSALFGSVAYCAQEPWILTGTIEENIVFGDDAVRARIPDAIAAACLDRDLEILPNGLGTQIGEKGINLSGGQKARVALARAIARDADVYLLDDPIAALDAHVGKKVFDDAICGVLRGKTVILVTHQLHLLPKVDMVVVLDEGRVVETGAFRELMAREGGALAEIMKDYHFDENETKTAKEGEEEEVKEEAKAAEDFEEEKAVDEDRRTGKMDMPTFRSFFLSGGKAFFGGLVIAQLLSIASNIFSRIYLDIWLDNKWHLETSLYLKLYLGVNAIDLLFIAILLVVVFVGCYIAALVFHDRALDGLLRSPMAFFDGQPIGRILNRMTADVQAVDTQMIALLVGMTNDITGLVASIAVVSYTSPFILIQFAVILGIVLLMFRFYQRSFREIKRLSSIMRSPLAAHVSETLNGVPTIRAYKSESIFIAEQEKKTDLTNSSTLFMTSSQFWIAFRLQILSATVMFVIVALAAGGAVSATAVGLALTSSMQLGDSLITLMLSLSNIEGSFNAVERLNHYAYELEAEAPRKLPADPKDGEWPTAGAVAIRDLEIRYPSRPDHAVIQDLSLDIQPGEKVGVVGRTGSGKSTLMTALFRIMEASKGSIAIDGIDIASLGLKTLRSRLQIIPQDPVLFRGTVRSNLDFGVSYTDDELWAALGLVGLKDFVGTLDGKLDAIIDENGANLSMGQRQLMCLCKAILAKPKVLIMDEATASVDAEADKRIQESLKTQFAATTVLSIAHRLNTIAAFDRVLVLDGGRIAEFDAPHVLLGRAGSVFGDMVDATGDANAAVIRQIAAEHFAKTH